MDSCLAFLCFVLFCSVFLVDKINVTSCISPPAMTRQTPIGGYTNTYILMVRFFHVVEIVGTTCELVGTSRVCFNHVVRSRACACTNVQRDASRHCRHYVIVLFHVVTCSTDAEPVCRAFLSSLLCRLLVITRKSRDCSVT